MEAIPSTLTLEEFLKDESKFVKQLEASVIWRSIPLLNYTPIHELNDLSLVRFRGMIQDMLDPEIYLEQYQVVAKSSQENVRFQNGKYRDCLVLKPDECVNFDCRENVQGERRTMFVVSLPAINAWASAFEEQNCIKPYQATVTRDVSVKVTKRPMIEDNADVDMDQSDTIENEHKRQCRGYNHCTATTAGSSSLSMEYLLNSPIPSRPSKACMVKLYSDFETHALNSIVDVVGFLSVDPALDASTMSCDEYDSQSEIQAQNPPPSLIPRLHAVAVRKLTHNNPLLDPSFCEEATQSINFSLIYKDLKIILTQCLMGDDLAAEYLLAHLISTVYVRSDLDCIGKFALNICNIPQEVLPSYTEELYEILELFLPASHYLPMTLDNMNTFQFFPKKDYETNKLTSGILQLAPHTHIVLDETRLLPGVLDANGVQAIQSLAHFIKSQQIKCNFRYYDIDFNTDIPVLVLSEGRSILPTDFLVPLKPEVDCIRLINETLKAAKHYVQPKLEAIRRYLTSAKTCSFSMDPGDNEMIERDFVEMRKENSKVGADDLHNLLVLSRLWAIANGKSSLSKESWEQAKTMERLRRARVETMPKSNKNL